MVQWVSGAGGTADLDASAERPQFRRFFFGFLRLFVVFVVAFGDFLRLFVVFLWVFATFVGFGDSLGNDDRRPTFFDKTKTETDRSRKKQTSKTNTQKRARDTLCVHKLINIVINIVIVVRKPPPNSQTSLKKQTVDAPRAQHADSQIILK